jgi:hypothetical protein
MPYKAPSLPPKHGIYGLDLRLCPSEQSINLAVKFPSVNSMLLRLLNPTAYQSPLFVFPYFSSG